MAAIPRPRPEYVPLTARKRKENKSFWVIVNQILNDLEDEADDVDIQNAGFGLMFWAFDRTGSTKLLENGVIRRTEGTVNMVAKECFE